MTITQNPLIGHAKQKAGNMYLRTLNNQKILQSKPFTRNYNSTTLQIEHLTDFKSIAKIFQNFIKSNKLTYLKLYKNNKYRCYYNYLQSINKDIYCNLKFEKEIYFGFLYPAYICRNSNELSITSSNDWFIPTYNDYLTLLNYLGGITIAGGPLKENNPSYWESPNTGATNIHNTNFRGSGMCKDDFSGFSAIRQRCYHMTKDLANPEWNIRSIRYDSVATTNVIIKLNTGLPIRLFRNATEEELMLDDGDYSYDYIGNDGHIYKTRKVGTQIIIENDLIETKLRNGQFLDYAYNTDTWNNTNPNKFCIYINNEKVAFGNKQSPITPAGKRDFTHLSLGGSKLCGYAPTGFGLIDNCINVFWNKLQIINGVGKDAKIFVYLFCPEMNFFNIIGDSEGYDVESGIAIIPSNNKLFRGCYFTIFLFTGVAPATFNKGKTFHDDWELKPDVIGNVNNYMQFL